VNIYWQLFSEVQIMDSLTVVLIGIVGAHILEEVFAPFKLLDTGKHAVGFRRFFNLEWFKTGDEEFPVTKCTALVKDQVLLFIVLSLLALGSTMWPVLMWVVVGFIIADLIQHSVFSLVRRKYSPGVATSVLYLIFVIYFLGSEAGETITNVKLGAMALGAALLVLNYVMAVRKVYGRGV